MSLVRESTLRFAGFTPGDTKMAHYDIAFTLNQLVEPTNDPGWYLLNGAVASQTTAAAAFALFGTSYNTGGEGGGNFRLPDLTEGRVPITLGLTNFTALAVKGGAPNITLTTSQLPSHTHADTFSWAAIPHSHSVAGTTAPADPHGHTAANTNVTGATSSRATGSEPTYNFTGTGTSGLGGGHAHSATLSIANNTSTITKIGSINDMADGSGNPIIGGNPHNNMQPYIVIGGWLVKYK